MMYYKTTDFQAFSSRILSWYRTNPRDLPWRRTHDPYKIWLSEIILQQTRVAQGLPYYNAFVDAYPTVKELALAPEEEVLRLWQGLGYYSRARNLHACAKSIWFGMGGEFPDSYDQLIQLKGVGSYTAAAIASFAFGETKAVVDGNVFRVLARYFGIESDISGSRAKKEFETLANQLIPDDTPGEFNQAMMDFGARQCVPKKPDCTVCPLQVTCFAYLNKRVTELPVKLNKIKIKERHFHYYVIRCGSKWVWKRRKPGDIWEGLFDFPHKETGASGLIQDLDLPFGDGEADPLISKNYRHILSHQKLNAVFSSITIPEDYLGNLEEWCEKKGFDLVEDNRIEYLAKPKLIVNFLNDHGI